MKPKILFVEDEIAVIQAYKPILESDGFEVIAVSNQLDAEKNIKEFPELKFVIVDLVIFKNESGVRKEIEFGLNVLKFIKENRPNLPIIVFTANRMRVAADLGKLGVSLFVDKGSSEAIDKLISHVHNIMENSGGNFERSLALAKNNDESLMVNIPKPMPSEIYLNERIFSISDEGDFELIKHLVGFKKDIKKQIERFPYSKNVFLMMKFRNSNQALSDFIIETLSHYGLRGVRADQEEWNLTKDIYNPIAVLYCCKYGIALFDEAEENQAFSPNVAYELGMMHSQNKHCLILRHNTLPIMPFDLLKDLYEPYTKGEEIGKILTRWIRQISS